MKMVRTLLCQPLCDPKVFSDNYEPTCCCCTPNGLILIGSGSGSIHVYSASGRSTCRIVHSFPAAGISKKLAYCSFRGYIISVETKSLESRSGTISRAHNARVYVNWTNLPGESSYLTHHRAGYSKETSSIHNYAGKYLVIDIPIKYSVTDTSCCEETGNLAVSTEAKCYLFICKAIHFGNTSGNNSIIDFDCALEIDSGFQINQVSLFRYYIALASSHEIRVINVIMDKEDTISQAEDVTKNIHEQQTSGKVSSNDASNCLICKAKADDDFILWNIDQGSSQGLDSLEHETLVIQREKTPSTTQNTPTYVVEQSCVKMNTIRQDATFIDSENTAKEVIGPKENLKGHPLLVINVFRDSCYTDIRHVTMLYRRFYNEQFDQTESYFIHSLQLLPVYADFPENLNANSNTPSIILESQMESTAHGTLLSLGLFFSNGRKGFLYDMLNFPRLLTEYDFTEECISACLARKMLNVVTRNGLETYTTRLYSSAAQNAKSYFPDSTFLPYEAQGRERAYSSVSFSSGSELDSKGHVSDLVADFSEEEHGESQDGITPKEGYFTKEPPERRASSTQSKSRIPFRHRKKEVQERYMNKSPASDEESSKRERLLSLSLLHNTAEPVVYNWLDLIQPCPPTSIEICLIAIYPLRGFTFIGSTEKHIVLLQKTFEFKDKPSSLMRERTMPWNVYVREITPALDVSIEIMKLIEGSEFANPNVFHQLISESHLFLKADLSFSTAEDRKEALRLAIKRSAVKLGDFFSRCGSSFDYLMAKEYYNMAAIKLEQVLLRHSLRDKEEQLSSRYGIGMIQYLNEKVLSEEEEGECELLEESALHILNIYATAAPQLLSNIILRPKLRNVPADKAVSLLESFISPGDRSSKYKLSDSDFIVVAILRLQMGDLTQAEHVLRKLSDKQLIQAISKYPDKIWNGEKLSHLGQLLRKHFSRAFTDLLVSLYDSGIITLSKALGAHELGEGSLGAVKQNFKGLGLLETLLNDEKRKDDFPEIMDHLLRQYFLWFEANTQPELLKIPHYHAPKGSGHFAPRYEWLDKLPPFSGDLPVPQDCLRRKQQQKLSARSSPEESPLISKKSTETLASSQICTCCCCNSVLLKIQKFVEKDNFLGNDSLKLLCYPFTGKTLEAVEFVVQTYPGIMLQYGKDIFQSRKDQWEVILSYLLKVLKNELHERWNKETYLDALKGTLTKLARLCTPSELVNLLPNDGTARFFLPFVVDSYQIHRAVTMRNEILQTNMAFNT